MAGRISKNQRTGQRQESNIPKCGQGHAQVRVLVVKVKGRPRFFWVCTCDGYAPITDERQKKAQ